MNPGLCKLAHVELVTPELDRSIWFFCDLLGLHEVERDDERVYLRCFSELDHHSLVLREGPTGVDHVAFRTTDGDDVGRFAERFGAEGIEVHRVQPGAEAGQGEAIRVMAPGLGAPIELFFEMDKPLAPADVRSKLPTNSARFSPCAVRRIDHINLATALSDLGRAETWVREALGFKRREALLLPDGTLGASWLSVTPQVHDLAITADEGGRQGRLNHLAFNLEEFADINRLADVLADHAVQVDISPGRHGITQGHFYYVRDPGSGHRIELFSGGYLIFDPDWTPVEWKLPEFSDFGLKWVGPPEWTRETNLNAENTPATAPDAIGVSSGG